MSRLSREGSGEGQAAEGGWGLGSCGVAAVRLDEPMGWRFLTPLPLRDIFREGRPLAERPRGWRKDSA